MSERERERRLMLSTTTTITLRQDSQKSSPLNADSQLNQDSSSSSSTTTNCLRTNHDFSNETRSKINDDNNVNLRRYSTEVQNLNNKSETNSNHSTNLIYWGSKQAILSFQLSI